MSYPTELVSGTLVDRRYRIQKTLGQGGFGRTYLVFDERRFNDPCVLKEFVPRVTEEYVMQKCRELFKREAQVLHQLTHPQIPGFLEHFEEGERLFLSQDYIDGKTYRNLRQDRQREGRTFSETEIRQWLQDLLPVLDYIHSRNIIHRDISPDNIMLPNRGDRPILIDFGVVNQQNLTQASNINYDTSQPGTTVGKIGYSPIEQIQQGKCYPNSDLYSLAVTALVLLSGKEPEQFFDSYRMQWKWRDKISLSDDLGRIFDKILKISPQQRYQSAQEILADLAASPITFYIPSVSDTSNSSVPATFVCPTPSDREVSKIGVATVLSEKVRSQNDRAFSNANAISIQKNRNIIRSSLVIISIGFAVMGIKYFSETQKQNDLFDRQTNTENTDLFDNPNAPQSPIPKF